MPEESSFPLLIEKQYVYIILAYVNVTGEKHDKFVFADFFSHFSAILLYFNITYANIAENKKEKKTPSEYQ